MEVVLSKLFPNEIVDHLMEYITYNNIPIWRNEHKKKYFIQLNNNLQNFMTKVREEDKKNNYFYYDIYTSMCTNICAFIRSSTLLQLCEVQRYIEQGFIKLVQYHKVSMFRWYGADDLPDFQFVRKQGQWYLEMYTSHDFVIENQKNLYNDQIKSVLSQTRKLKKDLKKNKRKCNLQTIKYK